MSNQEQQSLKFDMFEITEIIIGGRGKVNNYNLNIFTGRISKLYQSDIHKLNDNQFLEIESLCQIPKEIEGEQIVNLIKGLKIFSGSESILYNFKQVGDFYQISGWVKYDFTKIIKSINFSLLRISLFLDYKFATNEGDEIFYLTVSISKEAKYLSCYVYIQDVHEMPIYGSSFSTLVYRVINSQILFFMFVIYAKLVIILIDLQISVLNVHLTQIVYHVINNWKSKIRAFYKEFIEKLDSKHPFVLYGQSQEQDDYEIKCEICQKGYRLYQNQCIPTCLEPCLECQNKDGVDQCVLCPLDTQGRQLTIQNNSCIQCPQYCTLCRERSSLEINQINSLFNNQKYLIFTYQCLKSFQDKDYYYDNYLGRYIDCENYQSCQKVYIIQLNLYCDRNEYQSDLNQILENNEINNFKKQNILLDNLISKEQGFSEFQNDYFYLIANQDSIKTILFKISGKKQQNCIIDIDGIIQQQFSQNIFSSINIEIQISFEYETKFYISKSLSFLNFQKIELNNVQFIFQQNNKHKFIAFTSVLAQKIKLKNINLLQSGNSNDQTQIYFENISELLIDNLELNNLVQNSVNYFIEIQQSQQNQKDIEVENLNIRNSIISNQQFIYYEQNSQDVINFLNWTISGEIYNFSILTSNQSQISGNIQIENFKCMIDAQDTIIFNLDGYVNVKVNNILLEQSRFTNSSLFCLNQISFINDIKILNSAFNNQSLIIFNSNKMIQLSSQLNYEFKNFLFENNFYDESSKFIKFKKFTSNNSKFIGGNFIISGNQIFNISESFNLKAIQSALLYFEFNIIKLSNILINRGYGLIEISIFDSNIINLIQVHITQLSRFKNLQQSFECLNEHSKLIKQPSITIYSSQNVIFQNCSIYQTQVFNNPIIYYQSADIIDKTQVENITFINMQVSNNIVIQTVSNVNYALIYIISNQITNINFDNNIFINNILNVYQQDYSSISALLLNINANKGFLIINNSFISQNVAYNTSNSIIYFKLQEIKIQNSKFQENNVFIYENIQIHLGLEYYNQNIYLEDLLNIFKIKSESGNGVFTSSSIYLINTTFKYSKGAFGGAFSIYPQLASRIQILNIEISHTSTLFTEENEAGGGIFIDGVCVIT